MSASRESRQRNVTRLFELVSDFYWEQDAGGRFTQLERFDSGVEAVGDHGWLGKTPAQIGLETQTGGHWPSQQHTADPDSVFRDWIVAYPLDDGTTRSVSLSGEAVLDANGRPDGYRGFGRDVTAQQSQQRELLQFRAAMDTSQDMIYITDRETMRFVYVNRMACELTGLERDALLRVPPYELLMIDRAQLERDYDEVIRAGGVTLESPSRTGDGRQTVVEVHRTALRQGGRWLIVSNAHDIYARKRAEWARERLEHMYAALSATNEAILRAATPEDLYRRVCEAAVDGAGLAAASVLLSDPDRSLVVKATAGVSAETIAALAISVDPSRPEGVGLVGECFRSREPCVSNDYLKDERTRPWHAEARAEDIQSAAAIPFIKGGEILGVMLLASNERRAFDDDGVALLQRMVENLVFALENFEHEAARKRGEAHIEYLATHDSLSGLPNRNLFNQLLVKEIDSARRHKRRFALMFIDLDRFKIINDSLGHDAGDTLLKTIAGRLEGCLRASDAVARVGGDEFLALVQEIGSGDAAAHVARTIIAAVLEPVQIRGQDYRVTASVGIAIYPEDAEDAASLQKHADMAMYQAKEEGKNTFQFYSADMKARAIERIRLETGLRQAAERGEFTLAYQARISLATEKITGVEALLRWHSAELGELTPNQFLSVAEETGLIVPIGRWVLRTACAQSVAWQEAGLPPVRVAVNLSPVQFADAHLLIHIEEALRTTGLPPDLLELEITESAVMRDVGRSLDILGAVKRLGARVAIDNFGTGYSSLAQLRQLPVDSLKIDRSFIRKLSQDVVDQSTARAIIAIARDLSLNVVAEGVETAEQQTYLRSQDCDDVQGFYFSRPDDHVAFAELLRTYSRSAGEV